MCMCSCVCVRFNLLFHVPCTEFTENVNDNQSIRANRQMNVNALAMRRKRGRRRRTSEERERGEERRGRPMRASEREGESQRIMRRPNAYLLFLLSYVLAYRKPQSSGEQLMNESDALHQSRITKWKGEVGSGEIDVTAIQFEAYKRVSTLLYTIYRYICTALRFGR